MALSLTHLWVGDGRFFELWMLCSACIPIRSVSEASRTRHGSGRCWRVASNRKGPRRSPLHRACEGRGMKRTSLT
jgi:hypothetical protein